MGEWHPSVDQRIEVVLTVGTEADRHLKGLFSGNRRVDAHTEGGSGFQGIDDVQVVSPRLGEVFPGMAARVAADVPFLPDGRWTVRVMGVESVATAGALIAENLVECAVPHPVGNELSPVAMPDLVAEMPQQGAVGFGEVAALALAFHWVGLGDIDCDQFAGMAGDHLRPCLKT